MTKENKSVFHVIREKGAARVAVALLAGIAFPPGPSAPANA